MQTNVCSDVSVSDLRTIFNTRQKTTQNIKYSPLIDNWVQLHVTHPARAWAVWAIQKKQDEGFTTGQGRTRSKALRSGWTKTIPAKNSFNWTDVQSPETSGCGIRCFLMFLHFVWGYECDNYAEIRREQLLFPQHRTYPCTTKTKKVPQGFSEWVRVRAFQKGVCFKESLWCKVLQGTYKGSLSR